MWEAAGRAHVLRWLNRRLFVCADYLSILVGNPTPGFVRQLVCPWSNPNDGSGCGVMEGTHGHQMGGSAGGFHNPPPIRPPPLPVAAPSFPKRMANPLAIDLNRAVLRVDATGVLVQRPAEEASIADSYHNLFIVSQALAVSLRA